MSAPGETPPSPDTPSQSDATPEPSPTSEQPQHPPFSKDAKLSEQLAYIHAIYGNKPLQLREVINVLGGHAPLLLVVLLALPFTIPLPIPISTPFGLAIVIVAISLIRGKDPHFSERILNAKFPPGVHDKLVRFSKKIIGWIERWMHPGRGAVLLATPTRERLHAVGLLLSGIYLLLPLPVPFSNTFPAWAILIVSSGLLGRDGVLVMVGHTILAVGVFYLVFLGGAVAAALEVLKNWIVSLF